MKQRLIDANEFAIEEPKLWDWNSVNDISSTAVLKQCIWDVQCAPVVDAIPVEWIRHYKSIYGLTYSTLFNLLETMIEDWEKENETN